MILIDTSVWVGHFRSANARLIDELAVGRALVHPFVIGELACGNLHNRREVLDLLARLPSVPTAAHADLIDVHLLASTALAAPTRLWTRDRRLATVASALNLAYE